MVTNGNGNGHGRASAVLDELRRQVEQRRASLDHADDLGEITITIKLQAGTCSVRGVVWSEELVRRLDSRVPRT